MKRILFESNSLIGDKTGVGYFSEYLLKEIENSFTQEKKIYLGYFNFLGKKKSLVHPDLRIRENRFIPSKIAIKLLSYKIVLPLRWIWSGKYDIAIFPNFFSFGVPRKTKKIVMIHDLAFIVCPQYLENKHGRILQTVLPSGASFLSRIVPYSVKTANIVLTGSEAVKKEIVVNYKIPPDRINVIPIIPDTSHSPLVDKPEKNESLPNNFLLFQATFEPRKNHITLVEAYALLPKKIQRKYPLILSGKLGWSSEELLNRIEHFQKQGLNIITPGYVDKSYRISLYRQCSLYIQPSHYEGFGMPILEALMCGSKVICSNIPVFKEVGGDSVKYFNKDSPKEIAKLITRELGTRNKNTNGELGVKQVKNLQDKNPISKLLGKLQ